MSTLDTKIILYIDNDPEARYLMADIIRFKGHKFIETGRGLEGIRLAKEHLPDLILIDLQLPDMQGSEVTTHLKSLPELLHTQIIALTGESQQNIKEMLLTAGCDGYIPNQSMSVNLFSKSKVFYPAIKKKLNRKKKSSICNAITFSL